MKPSKEQEERDAKNKKMAVLAVVGIALFVLWRGAGVATPSRPRPASTPGPTLKVATWNIAAINNNPFEYWITHSDQAYNKLMLDVQDFINQPGAKDVRVDQVFTDSMMQDLLGRMRKEGWIGVQETEGLWNSDFRNRKIISQFMKDGSLGEKRLASMPDRVTNTIRTASGVVYRPTVIKCYQSKFADANDWWKQWSRFIFDSSVDLRQDDGSVKTVRVVDKLKPIPRAKYPALSEEEERISIPLQTMAGAIFDAILYHIVSTVSGEKWQDLRTEMCQALNLKKTDHTLEIIERVYGDSDIIFLQEVASEFIKTAERDPLLGDYSIVSPSVLGSRDQNSVIFMSKALFDPTSVVEVTDQVMAIGQQNAKGLAQGDILAITVSDRSGNKYMLASFHGDTNGIQTIPVVTAVHETFVKLGLDRDGTHLLFGLDANVYEHAKPGKTQDVTEFAAAYVNLGLSSIKGDHPDPTDHTTYNARTYLQPQLNKAARKDELVQKGDVNPKDFILYYRNDFDTVSRTKDNTGHKRYKEGMVFPTLEFPSDHGVLSAVVKKNF